MAISSADRMNHTHTVVNNVGSYIKSGMDLIFSTVMMYPNAVKVYNQFSKKRQPVAIMSVTTGL